MVERKVLCCADLHLGRSSACLSAPEGVDTTAVGAWNRIVDRAVASEADAVAIAGDVFDGFAAYYETRQAFRNGLLRLKQAGIPVVAIAGNHDWKALPSFCEHFPDTEIILLGRGLKWECREVGGITFAGLSFDGSQVRRCCLDDAPSCDVALVHGDLDAPTSVYHYLPKASLDSRAKAWVLGHIHKPADIHGHAVYCGSPQALDFGPGEAGPHGCYWLYMRPEGCKFEFEPTSTVRFECDEVRVCNDGSCDFTEAVERAFESFCESLRELQPGLHAVQARFTVRAEGYGSVKECEVPSISGRHGWAFVKAICQDPLDPAELASQSTALGIVARQVLALQRDAVRTDADWIKEADRLVERTAADLGTAWNRLYGPLSDKNLEDRPQRPSENDLLDLARTALLQAAERDLRARVDRQAEEAR